MKIKGGGILVINSKNELLVLHRISSVREGNTWDIPGGAIINNQTYLEVAINKTKQEVGLVLNKEELTHFHKFEFKSGENDIIFDTWIYKINYHKKLIIKLDTNGHDTYKWEKPESLLKQNDLMQGMYTILSKFIQHNDQRYH